MAAKQRRGVRSLKLLKKSDNIEQMPERSAKPWMEIIAPSSLFNSALVLAAVVLLGCFVLTRAEVSVHLRYRIIDVISFNCSNMEAFPDHDPALLRMIQIKHLNDKTKNETVWATLDRSGTPESPLVFLKTVGERSINITGSFSKFNVSWLHLAMFDPELDFNMKNYGTVTCSVWHQYKKKPWVSEEIKLIPGVRLHHEHRRRFVVRHGSTIDLSCNASIPTAYIAGGQDIVLKIVRKSDEALLGSWSQSKVLQCPQAPNVTCSTVFTVNEIYNAKVRLMDVSDVNQDYECRVDINDEKLGSQVISIKAEEPERVHCSDNSFHVVPFVSGGLIGVLLGALSTLFIMMKRSARTSSVKNKNDEQFRSLTAK